MKKTRNNREASLLPKLQPFFPQEGMASVAVVEDRDRHPKACIKGDIICSVAEQEVARGPITGHYTVVMEDMAEPLFVLGRLKTERFSIALRDPQLSPLISPKLVSVSSGHLRSRCR